MKIGLVGWGVETKSALAYYGDDHEYTIVNEEPILDPPSADNITIHTNLNKRQPGLTGNATDLSYLDGINSCDTIVLSATAQKTLEKKYPSNHAIWQKTTTALQIFYEQSPTTNIIGVTGTKGKGTTSSLIAAILQKAGYTTHLAGNIGVSVLEVLPKIAESDWVVLELSSFQLYKIRYSPHIAVHLMMVPEHIAEWHHTMEDYVASKRNIFAHQTASDIAIYYPANEYSSANVESSLGIHVPYMASPGAIVEGERITIDDQHIIDVHDISLKGDHNLQNICAAVTAAWQVTQDSAAIRSAIRQFTGLEHRLQTVRTHKDVIYIDDSFGTTPDTALVAMDAFKQQKVIIVGGHDKGSDYSPILERIMKDDVKHAICIGPVGNWIAQELRAIGHENKCTYKTNPNDWTMNEIVSLAESFASPGDTVLLSCGSSSFGIFADYKDRGNQFIEVVNSLT